MNMPIGLGGILFVVFVILKLMHYIAWSWWWVTSPLWISAIIQVLLLFLVAFLKVWGESKGWRA